MSAPRLSARVRRVPWRVVTFLVLLAAYVVLTLGVIHHSPLLTLDRDVVRLDLRQRFYEWLPGFKTYAMLGQRAPATVVALPWFAWRAWMSRSPRPLILLATALVVLNLSVGVVKLATGRLGPLVTRQVHAVFEGGDIFPSGHVSNAVVLYGAIAMVAVRYRKSAAVAAVFISFTVGVTTVFLDTHWLSDVVGGWLAGGLVLIVLPWVMPYAERAAAAVGRLGRWIWRISHPVVDDDEELAAALRAAALDSTERPGGTEATQPGRPARAPSRAAVGTTTHAEV